MSTIPTSVNLVIIATTLLTVFLFLKASRYSKVVLAVLIAWMGLQAVITLSGFYTVTQTLPPRFALLPVPPLLFIIALFLTSKGKKFIDSLDSGTLTLLHIVRIPVELVLFWLFLAKGVPQLMTFEGRNFDILSGITAPVVYYFGFVKKRLSKSIILIWNFICVGLLFNIVILAILCAPTPFQKLAFDQPNVAILFFPFSWLPCVIVPLVLFSHLVVIRKLIRQA